MLELLKPNKFHGIGKVPMYADQILHRIGRCNPLAAARVYRWPYRTCVVAAPRRGCFFLSDVRLTQILGQIGMKHMLYMIWLYICTCVYIYIYTQYMYIYIYICVDTLQKCSFSNFSQFDWNIHNPYFVNKCSEQASSQPQGVPSKLAHRSTNKTWVIYIYI